MPIPTLMVKLCIAAAVVPDTAFAQSAQQPIGPIRLPTVTVTAQKEPTDAQTLPVALTAVSRATIEDAGLTIVSDGAVYAPNTYFSEFTARKLSFGRFRGIGSSPANPSITTYVDGVPQLNANSSSMELMDVERIELVRGPQSALFGRNTLGGLVNIASVRPSLTRWSTQISVPIANQGGREVRASASGPIVDGQLGAGLSIVYGRRDGFTVNDVTGRDLDYRSAFSGKGQLLWTPTAAWETRLIVTGERARDGDYALADLAALRGRQLHAARDFEGRTDRDLLNTTVLTRREGGRVSLSTATGFVRWKTADATDLDYTPAPLVTRDNTEESFQFTQEVRLASTATSPVRVSDRVRLKWQTGVFLFTQDYDQDAVNSFAPFLLSPLLAFPVSQHSPQAALDDVGVGFYGQGTATVAERVDVSAGLRLDHERKQALLNTFFSPAFAPAVAVDAKRSFSNVSPQASVAFRLQPEKMVYAAMARGFKAGGFNPASPAGSEAYGEEHTWSVEGGAKTTWADGRLVANAAAFHIDWQDLQLNLPDPRVPAQFYIANVGGASSKGVELELNARLHEGVDLFGALGYNRARFKQGSVSNGVNVAGNKLPNTPDYTATLGVQIARDVRPAAVYGRAEVVCYGAFQYDDMNSAAQEAYSLTNLRAGVRRTHLFVEAWVKNAFNTPYIPVAFAYGSFAPSGFVGESGRPRTFGISVGFFR